MTRTSTTPTSTGTDDPLHHPPKPATQGLGTATESPPEGFAGDRATQHPPKPADVGLRGDNEPLTGDHHPAGAADQRGITDLIKELRDEATLLFRQEVQLAKTEMSEKASFFARQGGKLAAGIAVLAIGGLMLLAALAYFVGAIFQAFFEMAPSAALGLGYLIVGGIVAIIGYALYRGAQSKITKEPATPERTLQTLKDDKQWLTEKTEQTH